MGVQNYMLRILGLHMEEVTGFHTVTFKVMTCSLICAQDRDRWLALVDAVMNIWVPLNVGTRSLRTLLHGVSMQ
jgi:hypothetical protein